MRRAGDDPDSYGTPWAVPETREATPVPEPVRAAPSPPVRRPRPKPEKPASPYRKRRPRKSRGWCPWCGNNLEDCQCHLEPAP